MFGNKDWKFGVVLPRFLYKTSNEGLPKLNIVVVKMIRTTKNCSQMCDTRAELLYVCSIHLLLSSFVAVVVDVA